MLDAQPEPAAPPTLEGGRYVIAGVVGKGGNATVYQAWDQTMKAWRAIKVMKTEFLSDASVRARFAQEAATMARLDHPNLVSVYDISDDPFTPHIVMELCSGGSIIDWMKVHGAVAPQRALDIIRQVALGVQVAHQDGIVHRDIKPQNILIDSYGAIKLTDFGIARDEDNSLTRVGDTIGTYAFMAPEQRTDSTSVDVRSDVYSLGATLFTLSAVKTTTELFVAEPEDALFDGLPDPIVQFILTCCAYKPKKRYQDIEELLTALAEVSAVLPPDPEDAPPITALATPLAPHPPSGLPDFAELGDLLKALALAHGDGPALDSTTLGTSRPVAVGEWTPAGELASPVQADAVVPAIPPSRNSPPHRDPGPTLPVPETRPVPEATPFPVDESVTVNLQARRQLELIGMSVVTTLLAVLAVVGVLTTYGALQVQGAARDVDRARDTLVTAVLASGTTLDRLDPSGNLGRLHASVQGEAEATGRRDAKAYATSLRTTISRNTPTGEALMLSRNVLKALDDVENAESTWINSTHTVPGRLATGLGLTPSP